VVGNLPYFKIKSVILSGDETTQIEAKMAELKGRSIFSGVIARTVDSIETDYKVEKFTCYKGIPDTLSCKLVLKKPIAVWQSGDLYYLIDRDGVIFSEQASVIPGQFVIEDRLLLPVKNGAVVLSPEIIKHFQNLKTLLEEQKFIVNRFMITESLFQVTVIVDKGTHKGIEVQFLLSNNLQESVTSLVSTFTSRADSIKSSIDLRVPGYVYVK